MVRIVGLMVAAAPALGARLAIQSAESANAFAVARGLELLASLKENPEDVSLQNEYRNLLGDVEWAENKVFLETGVKIDQPDVQLGSMSQPGTAMVMSENTGFAESLGRFLTNRRDYVFEREGGNSEYVFDGSTLSLHSRMHVTVAGEEQPRFIVRRAFNYLNPLASIFGQFVYRVIQCTDPHDGQCSEGDIVYTITKDRLGRGALWGMDEYRVYSGTGGCGRWGHGIVGCHQDSQVLYSLGAGLSEGTFDTDFYKGNIVAIHGDGESGTVSIHGRDTRVGDGELSGMKVASSIKVEGPPRALNWIAPIFPAFGMVVETTRALIWTDSYRIHFEGQPVDELLLSAMVACQDLTRDVIATRAVASAAQNSAAAAGAATVSVDLDVAGAVGSR